MTGRIHGSLSRCRQVEGPYFEHKRRWAPFAAVPAVIVLTPIIVVLWALVRTTSRGPGLYTQYRLGRNGKPFRIVKLRTMRTDAEKGIGAVWSSANDPRVTWLGRLLRSSHLDELPQIFNVLAGDMCFVGPRPERPEIVEKLAQSIPQYLERLAVSPGVTGMAQLYLPPDTSIECVFKKLGFDFTYMERASLGMDLLVCVATAFKPFPFVGDWLCTTILGSPEFVAASHLTAEEIEQGARRGAVKAPRAESLGVEV